MIQGWQRFWFTPTDPTLLGLMRIATGALLVYLVVTSGSMLQALQGPEGWVDLDTADILRRETPWVPPPDDWNENVVPPVRRPELSKGPDADAYRRRWGLDPGQTIAQGTPGFSPWFHITDPYWMQIFHSLTIGVAVLFTLGLGTRVMSVLAWALALGYMHRNPAARFGADGMLAVLLLYLMLAPAGAALSLDRLIERFRAHGGQPRPLPSVSANVVLRLFQVHFCLLSLAAGASRLQEAAWWNATALWRMLGNYEVAPPRFASFTPLLRELSSNRLSWEVVFSAGVLLILALELTFPFLVWYRRWRWVMILGAILVHVGLAVAMGQVVTGLLLAVMVLAFVPEAPSSPATREEGKKEKEMMPA
jgi:hypothetical protein